MTQELATTFLPVTFGEILKNQVPGFFYFLFPDEVAERCPMPSIDLQVPGAGAVTLFWPAAAVAIVVGFLLSLWQGTRTMLRVLREGSQARQGLFLWSASLLWYACMCLGGFFFHCLHIYPVPHMLDLVGTGLSSLSVVAGFAAFTGAVDDRTTKQRLASLGFAGAFVALAILSPPLLQEQLYVVPSLLATFVGARFIRKTHPKVQGNSGQAAHRWLWLAGLGVLLALGVLPFDKWLCGLVGANYGLLFWFFTGCDIAILSTHQFAIVIADKNIHFTDVKTQ